MMHTTFIATKELAEHLEDPDWAIVDCRFSLAEPERGQRDYLQAHIPGAVYAHLNRDLSAPVVPGRTGRHPLPDQDLLAAQLGKWGIGPGVQVIAYDDWSSPGAIAARLWWLLRWLGHSAAAVLDGGWQQWQAEGRPTRSGRETRPHRDFIPRPRPELAVDSGQVEQIRKDFRYRLLDSRSADRFRGENETLDPIAGRIPGAISTPYMENVEENGRIKAPGELRTRFAQLMEGRPAERAVFYCGSGVTGAYNVLAFAHAGLGEARLYPGSWSEWITDPKRPIARGEED